MIYFFYGDNTDLINESCNKIADSFSSSPVFKINSTDFEPNKIEELILSQGMFSENLVVILDGVLEKKDNEEYFLDKIEEIFKSPNIFIFKEKKALKKVLDNFKKFGEVVKEFKLSGVVEKKAFNIFSLTEALGKRDRKSLWISFQEVVNKGATSEEIANILFWQVKMMILAKENYKSEEIATSGINPFVYSKAKVASKNFTEEELKKMSGKLVEIFHNDRRGLGDMMVGLEKFILKDL